MLSHNTYQRISQGALAGTYQAFPDLCRLDNGDILAVFYAGYHHISFPNEQYPRGGRICMTRSSDIAKTWKAPEVLYDTENDNRDPHISQMSDGSLICTIFTLFPCAVNEIGYPTEPVKGSGAQINRSIDVGKTWETDVASLFNDNRCYVSAPVRELPDGTYILGLYYFSEIEKHAWGGITTLSDNGKTWTKPVSIGQESGLSLPAETDLICLNDGSILAALRGDENERTHLHFSRISDKGQTWSTIEDSGFFGVCPHHYRVSSGAIL